MTSLLAPQHSLCYCLIGWRDLHAASPNFVCIPVPCSRLPNNKHCLSIDARSTKRRCGKISRMLRAVISGGYLILQLVQRIIYYNALKTRLHDLQQLLKCDVPRMKEFQNLEFQKFAKDLQDDWTGLVRDCLWVISYVTIILDVS